MKSINRENTSNNQINDMNFKINYDDNLLNTTLNNMELSEKTHEQYKYVMLMFLKCNNISFNELINTIKPMQHHKIEDNKIIEYNPNDSLLKNYYDKFINECKKNNNKEKSIQSKIVRINSILKQQGIKTPKIKFKIANTQQKTPLLTNKDISYIINNHCNIHQKAIITFMASSGIRRYDTLNFKIIDLLKATYQYHKTLNLDEFLNRYDNNMVGYWEFTPHKTKKNGLICKTCNSGESTNYIIESLKERQIAIDKYNQIHNTNVKLNVNHALFSNKRNHYTGHITPNGFTNIILEKNQLFKEHKIKSLNDDLSNDKISITEYDKLMNNIPIFKLHNLRHYFISVLRHYTTNRDIALIMEAHTSNIETDKYYLGESDELFNEETIRETYKAVEEYLTFNNSIEETNQLKKDNEKLLNDYNDLKNENLLLNNTLHELQEEQTRFKREYEETREKLELINKFVDIFELKEGETDLNKLKKITL